MSEWQDISTAPKDGTRILVCNSKYVASAHFRHSRYADLAGFVLDGGTMPNESLTHWMPLPPPPAQEGE